MAFRVDQQLHERSNWQRPKGIMHKFKQLANKLRDFLLHPLANRMHEPDAAAQIQLKLAFKHFSNSATEFDSLSDYGFRALSQADEDGILLFIFALIGSGSKRCVEICAGDGRECNTANLVINHGCHGLLVDGNETLCTHGQGFLCSEPFNDHLSACFGASVDYER